MYELAKKIYTGFALLSQILVSNTKKQNRLQDLLHLVYENMPENVRLNAEFTNSMNQAQSNKSYTACS